MTIGAGVTDNQLLLLLLLYSLSSAHLYLQQGDGDKVFKKHQNSALLQNERCDAVGILKNSA